jgi:catalase (peroxidase I)
VADVGGDVSGADVVVLAADADVEEACTRAPAAVLVVVGEGVEDRCQQVYDATLFPRARIIGFADPARAGAAIEAILLEREEEHDVIAMSDAGFGPRTARLGRGGIRALL